ncbi:MAG: ComEA family DNA-binding protein [Alicyclobacillaceae bacterium]|nr:ComEA family DNA-binding protein [Alicyclobacillaceae bacterium]
MAWAVDGNERESEAPSGGFEAGSGHWAATASRSVELDDTGCDADWTGEGGWGDNLSNTSDLPNRPLRPRWLRRWGYLWLVMLTAGGALGFACGRLSLAREAGSGDSVVAAAGDGTGANRSQAHRLAADTAVTAGPAGDASDNEALVVVDVHGDVRRPGVYSLPFGTRVKDAVTAAGGYRDPADAEDVNAAAPLDDGAEVVIPRHVAAEAGVADAAGGGTAAGKPAAAAGGAGADTADAADLEGVASAATAGNAAVQAGVAAGARIDLNTATAATLETLPGVGPARAAAIVSYREEHGPFPDLQSLRQVPGIGPVTWSRIAPYLYVAVPAGGAR